MLSKSLLTSTLLLFALRAHAKTDYDGCTSFTSTVTVRPEPGYGNTYNTIIWYVPDTLEICKGVDCGGGRAPPKAVPGCGSYHGTETVTPEFLTEDPMKPTQAVESKGAKETGKGESDEDGGEQEEEEEEEEENTTTTMTTSSKPAENASVQTTPAAESESKKGGEEEEEKTEGEKESKTKSEVESSTTDGEGAEQTGNEDSGAGVVGVNGMLAGVALAAVALL